MQETLLAAGMSGLNLAVIFHEVERGVRALHQVIVDGRDMAGAARQGARGAHARSRRLFHPAAARQQAAAQHPKN